jgi:HPt (histidine-containing phosphotransfer) domain-containing protein
MTSEIDSATFAELQEAVGAEFVRELIGTFLSEAPVMLADLRTAASQRDAERFRRLAHSLKSNGHTFGAMSLGAMARDLELGGLHADPAEDTRALDALDATYRRAATALEGLRHA